MVVLTLVGCGDSGQLAGPGGSSHRGEEVSFCLDSGFSILQSGVRKDGIPALTDPRFVPPGDPDAGAKQQGDRVIGVVVNGQALALPLSIMRWHEVVNLRRGTERIAVTYCPLTGTALGFDRAALGGRELGVSGLLVENNLLMYDRSTDESLWGQMLGSALCGTAQGNVLPSYPVLETTLEGWRGLHPETEILSTATGYDRDYDTNPYQDYDRLDAPPLHITELSSDGRLQPKARVLGIPSPEGLGVALPLSVLGEMGQAVTLIVDGRSTVVLWDPASEAAAVYDPRPVWADGFDGPADTPLTFQVGEDGITDLQTGSVWTVDGVARGGPATGSRLRHLSGSVVAYWFAWAAFNQGTGIVTTLP